MHMSLEIIQIGKAWKVSSNGVGRKISRRASGKKTGNSTIKPLPGRQRKKDQKIAKKIKK